MKNFSPSLREMVSSVWRNRQLLVTLTKREIFGRYRGSMLGILWSFFQPVFMLAVYTFVFSVVFKARWGEGTGSKAEFALILFAGLLVFNFFAESINRMPSLILSHANYVKKIVFPLEILPWVILGSSLFHTLVSFIVWILFYLLFSGLPHATVCLFPLILLPLLFMTLGLSWFFASLGVYLRDVGQIMGILTTVLMFLTPIFYPLSALPDQYRGWLHVNPLAFIVEQMRNVLLWNKSPNWILFGLFSAFSFFIAWLGFAWFQKTRKGFADVL